MTKQELRKQFPELYLEIINEAAFAIAGNGCFTSLEMLDSELNLQEDLKKKLYEIYEQDKEEHKCV